MIEPCAMWCTECGVRLTQTEIKGWGCPKCGNTGIPCSPDKDVFVEVNWHELRILTMWAENYAHFHASKDGANDISKNMPKIVYAIARRLEHQWPEMGALTFSGEIAELPELLEQKGISIGKIETNAPRSSPVITLGPGAVGFSKLKGNKDVN